MNAAGIGSFTRTLAHRIVKEGHRATVVGLYAPEHAGEQDDEGVRVVRLARTTVPKAGFALNGRTLRRALSDIRAATPIDVIEGQENGLAMLNKNFPAGKVIRMHGGHHFFAVTLGRSPAPWRSWLERRSFARADHICAVSSYVAETTRSLLKLGSRHIAILPNPVDTERFRPRPDIAEEDGLILFVGTICEKKGIRQLAQAMPAIVAGAPNARLLAIGPDLKDRETGRSFTEYVRTFISPELRERIVFHGRVENDQLMPLLARASVCVYPSHMEAMPVAWIEALAMGKAVVASATGPGPEVIEHGISGLLADPHSPEDIAAKTVQLLRDPVFRRSLAIAARRRAVESFSDRILIRRNLEFYRRCANIGVQQAIA